jgi:hypothetical protein
MSSSREQAFLAVAALAFECLDMQRVFIRKDEYFIEDKSGK